MSDLTPTHLSELLRLLDQSRSIPGKVTLPREAVNLLLDHIAALAAHPDNSLEDEPYQAGCGSWDCRAPECGRAK